MIKNYPGTLSRGEAAWHRIYSWGLSIVFDRTRHYSRVTTLRKGGNLVLGHNNYSYIKYIYNIKNRVYIRGYIWLNWWLEYLTSGILVTLGYNRYFVGYNRRKLLTRKDKYVSINYDLLTRIINGYVIRIYLLWNLLMDKGVRYANL